MHNSNNIAPPCDRGLTPSPWAGSPGRPPCASRTCRSCKSHRHPPWSPVTPIISHPWKMMLLRMRSLRKGPIMLKRMLKILEHSKCSIQFSDHRRSSWVIDTVKINKHQRWPWVIDNVDSTEPEREAASEESSDASGNKNWWELLPNWRNITMATMMTGHLIWSMPRLRMCLKENPLMSAITVTPAICVFTWSQ